MGVVAGRAQERGACSFPLLVARRFSGHTRGSFNYLASSEPTTAKKHRCSSDHVCFVLVLMTSSEDLPGALGPTDSSDQKVWDSSSASASHTYVLLDGYFVRRSDAKQTPEIVV